jgi:hypothetical protein
LKSPPQPKSLTPPIQPNSASSAAIASGKPTSTPQTKSPQLVGNVVHTYENGTSIVALEIRPTGQLIVALSDRPELHILDPSVPNPQPEIVHQFVSGSRILCMTTYDEDNYAIIVQSPNREPEDEAAQLYTWALSGSNKHDVQFVGDVQEANNFVSLTQLNKETLLASNSNGAIHRIHVENGTEIALFTDPTMANGIAGIAYVEPELYYIAPVDGIFARFQVDTETGDAVNPVEIIVNSGIVGVADFALVPWVEHEAYLVNYEQNSLLKVSEDAKVSTVVRGWQAPTSVVVSRNKDKKMVYIGTGGTLGLAGKIVQLDIE